MLFSCLALYVAFETSDAKIPFTCKLFDFFFSWRPWRFFSSLVILLGYILELIIPDVFSQVHNQPFKCLNSDILLFLENLLELLF